MDLKGGSRASYLKKSMGGEKNALRATNMRRVKRSTI